LNQAKNKAVLKHLREIRQFRETRAGSHLGRARNLARQAEADTREKGELRLKHSAEAAMIEKEILATMAGKTITMSSLHYLEAFQQRTAAVGADHRNEEAAAQSSLDQANRKLDDEQDRFRKVQASKMKLEELIDQLNKSADIDGWSV
jgi:hypothetical protein